MTVGTWRKYNKDNKQTPKRKNGAETQNLRPLTAAPGPVRVWFRSSVLHNRPVNSRLAASSSSCSFMLPSVSTIMSFISSCLRLAMAMREAKSSPSFSRVYSSLRGVICRSRCMSKACRQMSEGGWLLIFPRAYWVRTAGDVTVETFTRVSGMGKYDPLML